MNSPADNSPGSAPPPLAGKIRLSELFHSIQGEGSLIGTPSIFVRTTGCNLRCWFCDTPYTSWAAEGSQINLPILLRQILDYDCSHIVVTGGEPLLQPAVVPLIQSLRNAHKHVTIETAATLFRPAPASLFSISPKLANSTPPAERSPKWRELHERWRTNLDTVRRMLASADVQLKFVIDTPDDIAEVLTYLQALPEARPDQVWLMPQTTDQASHATKKTWLEPLAHQHGFHFSPRLHIEQWGNVRGK